MGIVDLNDALYEHRVVGHRNDPQRIEVSVNDAYDLVSELSQPEYGTEYYGGQQQRAVPAGCFLWFKGIPVCRAYDVEPGWVRCIP